MMLAAAAQSLNTGPHHFLSAANAALTTNDTINRNPIPRIMPKDSNRARINPQNPDCPALTGARQMRSRASFLQLAKDRGRANQQKNDAGDRGRHAFSWLAHAFEQALHR